MAEVYITKEAQQYSENIISQWLRDSGYDGSLEDGTSLYDVVIRPSSMIYSLFRQNIDKAYAYMSLSKANSLRSVLSEEDYDAAVDGIMSNWFVSRNLGGKATGKLRLYFSRALDFISFSDGSFIGSYNSVSYNARIFDSEEYSGDYVKAFNAGDFKSVMDTVNNTTEYYIDLPVISEENSDESITEGTVFTCTSPDIYFLRGVAAEDFVPGQAKETSDAFIARTQEAITTRELITRRALNTVLPDQFSDIRSLYIAGCGDPEMIRDVKTFENVDVHVGNKADLWVDSVLVRTSETCTVQTDANGKQYIELQNSPVHVLSIAELTDDEEEEALEESDWSFAMEEIDGEDDPLETTWFVPGKSTGKIYVNLSAQESDDFVDDDAVIVTLSNNAPYSLITEGKELIYKVSLNRALDQDMTITLNYSTYSESEESAEEETSGSEGSSGTESEVTEITVVIPAGSTESEAVTIQTREEDLYVQPSDIILVEIVSATVPGQDFENLQLVNPGTVSVIDGDDYSSDSSSEEDEEEESSTARTLIVHEITSGVAQSVQDFITSDSNRVVSFDPLVKMKVPVVMDFDISIVTNVNYAKKTSSSYDADATADLIADIRNVIKDYLNEADVYIESEMVQRLHTEVPAISVVYLPVTANATFFNMKTGKNVHMAVRDQFSLDDAPAGSDLSRQITTNTTQYYTNDDLINIELS
mgnify:CR=1 FL=1